METMRRTGEYRSQKIREYRASGLSRKEFCRREEISYWSFRDWMKKENTSRIPEREGLIKIQRTCTPAPAACIPHPDIHIANNLVIRVESDFDAELLRTVVRELGKLS